MRAPIINTPCPVCSSNSRVTATTRLPDGTAKRRCECYGAEKHRFWVDGGKVRNKRTGPMKYEGERLTQWRPYPFLETPRCI